MSGLGALPGTSIACKAKVTSAGGRELCCTCTVGWTRRPYKYVIVPFDMQPLVNGPDFYSLCFQQGREHPCMLQAVSCALIEVTTGSTSVHFCSQHFSWTFHTAGLEGTAAWLRAAGYADLAPYHESAPPLLRLLSAATTSQLHVVRIQGCLQLHGPLIGEAAPLHRCA